MATTTDRSWMRHVDPTGRIAELAKAAEQATLGAIRRHEQERGIRLDPQVVAETCVLPFGAFWSKD